ncbi:DUF2627 domain-containing protein [Paenibacillus beijingensis]|uniref:DUF2627 domain-containing protein n=1 Tax=Paenibacillus beijingensis TaxID=1126833 RepID=A0A0D5NPQ8_9BACL|nr:DUF2627 domain-containing protein [Paenibacillus beijingensis]AJY77241.1 hypothetical protein VN24_25165 [Paenibacillus beijingensis]
MKLVISRFIAVLVLVIPGIVACIGFLKMKDSTFSYFAQFGDDRIVPEFNWFMFIAGFVMFAAGIGFIGGWIFFRDRKHNYVAAKFNKKRSGSNV